MSLCTPTSYVSLRALVHNLRVCQSRADGKEIVCTVKADAYGHGALGCVRALHAIGAKHFAVASAAEALSLSGIFKNPSFCKDIFTYVPPAPTLLVLGPIDEGSFLPLSRLNAVLSVHSLAYAKRLNAVIEGQKRAGVLAPDFRQSIALKLETGMHRLGLATPAEAQRVLRLPHLFPHTLYSHFAEAGSLSGRTYCQKQAFAAWQKALANGESALFTHLSASKGLFRLGTCGARGARAGIALYGGADDDPSLLPVMRLCARVLGVTRVRRGEGVGYGSYRTPSKTRIAVLGIGYADGIPPSASGAFVFVRGTPCPIVGEVCMDRTLLDIGTLPVREGEEITLFGDAQMPAHRFAALCGISPYVLLSVRSRRTERVFVSS